MGIPSSQVIAGWVKESIHSEEWVQLEVICRLALKSRLSGYGESQLYDLVETNLEFVAEHLREDLASCEIDGVPREFEIDDDPSPYVRALVGDEKGLLKKLRSIDPFDFELVCAEILRKLGAQAEVTQKSKDGGVDFWAIDFDFVPDGILTPQACRAAVIGQAKRFKDGNLVKETDLRSFVGGAVRAKADLAAERRILPLSPVLFAFWTTSDFEPNAKAYARAVGIWYLGGRSLSRYVRQLGLESFVDQLEEKAR